MRFLICTDVAARGIDIAGLPFVIQRRAQWPRQSPSARGPRCRTISRTTSIESAAAPVRELVVGEHAWFHSFIRFCASLLGRCGRAERMGLAISIDLWLPRVMGRF